MKIIRWLLSHTFLILLIVAVIYGYMFWGNLAGEDTPAGKAIAYLSSEFVEVEEFVEAVKSKQAELSGERSSETSAAVADSNAQVSGADPRAMYNPVERPPAMLSYSQKQRQVLQNSAATGSQASSQSLATTRGAQRAASVAANGRSNERFVTADVEKQLSNVDGQGKVKDSSQTGSSVKQSWITARKSFYQRDYEKSIQSYQEVIDNTEENFDAYGELGNVYFNQGKNQQAASAYFEAAAILVKKGQVNRARSLMGLLRHLDQSKADELQALVNSAQS